MHLKCFWYPHARWRIFHKPIRATVENVENYTLEFLHNYLRVTDNAHYTPSGFVDSENKDGNFRTGEWFKQQCCGWFTMCLRFLTIYMMKM